MCSVDFVLSCDVNCELTFIPAVPLATKLGVKERIPCDSSSCLIFALMLHRRSFFWDDFDARKLIKMREESKCFFFCFFSSHDASNNLVLTLIHIFGSRNLISAVGVRGNFVYAYICVHVSAGKQVHTQKFTWLWVGLQIL